jgi:tRNA-2-methylthio-N6-dimethylallyladenosine synthase
MLPEISAAEVARQREICRELKDRLGAGQLALVDTYGCQQNEADSERLRGYLAEMGCSFTDDENEADIIIINTCAIREHAEQRFLGNLGALTHTKRRKPGQIIAVCGCSAQRGEIAERIKRSFRHVDLVFGPHALWRFPELLKRRLDTGKRVFDLSGDPGAIAEGVPVVRQGSVKAWLSIMYGCNNFCSYCIVPYVRGRERSRRPEEIVAEARQLVAEGYKDITLLGQNVNSYGRDLGTGVDFAQLLRMINDIPGDFVIRFMTSHPKDATEALYRAMAECDKVERHIHLPVQSGNDRVLKAMNRVYDTKKYLSLVDMARSLMPDIVITTDIIVGFPGETDEEFEDTLRLVERVRYDAMFTFIFSPREGTPAAKMPDDTPREVKLKRFDRLVELANSISAEKHAKYVGKTVRVLVDGESGDPEYPLTARTKGGRLVHLRGGAELIGSFAEVKITDSRTWALFGEVINA